jgi:hypothetical protein
MVESDVVTHFWVPKKQRERKYIYIYIYIKKYSQEIQKIIRARKGY